MKKTCREGSACLTDNLHEFFGEGVPKRRSLTNFSQVNREAFETAIRTLFVDPCVMCDGIEHVNSACTRLSCRSSKKFSHMEASEKCAL